MWKSLLPKVAIGGVCAGGIVGGIVYATLPDKYSHYLSKKGRVLLTKGSSQWEEMQKKYAEEGDGLLISINGQEIAKEKLTKEQLENWCLANSNNKFTDTKDTNYQRVSAWCTEPKTIKDLIGDSKSALIDTEPTASVAHSQDKEWKIKKDEYAKVQGDQHLIKTISGAKETTAIEANKLNDEKKLREWCKFAKDKHFKHEEDQRFLNYLKWCTIDKDANIKN